jgi:hypothetical protein
MISEGDALEQSVMLSDMVHEYHPWCNRFPVNMYQTGRVGGQDAMKTREKGVLERSALNSVQRSQNLIVDGSLVLFWGPWKRMHVI